MGTVASFSTIMRRRSLARIPAPQCPSQSRSQSSPYGDHGLGFSGARLIYRLPDAKSSNCDFRWTSQSVSSSTSKALDRRRLTTSRTKFRWDRHVPTTSFLLCTALGKPLSVGRVSLDTSPPLMPCRISASIPTAAADEMKWSR